MEHVGAAMPATPVVEALASARIVPVLRLPDPDSAADAARRMYDAGLPVVELTATTPGWRDALAAVRASHPDGLLGMGTITTATDARDAIDRGVDFLVSPYPAAAVREVAEAAGTLFVEGCFSPGELAAATARGVAKLFPAHVGGPQYLKSVLAVLPGARIVPTGGIRLEDVPKWLAAGALAVGIGSDLLKVDDPVARIKELVGD
jgi:2-dehydro-3-deoxyphosphogluconate aldolase / (4S)-4-hydroxy-2-oxoglutarate aldolase